MLLEICDRKSVWAQLFCWEHRRSDELCLNVEQDLGVLLAADHRLWAPGPPCSCSATFPSIFQAAPRNGSDRNVCYYSGVFAFQVYFPRSILGKNVGTCQPATSSSSEGETQPFCEGKAETCYSLIPFSFSCHFKSQRNQCFCLPLLHEECDEMTSAFRRNSWSELLGSWSWKKSRLAAGHVWLVQLFTGTPGSHVPAGDEVSLLSFLCTHSPWDGWEKESSPDWQGKEFDRGIFALFLSVI